jgi:two-component system sensor histidine kinase KdpD
MAAQPPGRGALWHKLRPYTFSVAVTALSTFVGSLMFGRFALADLIMVYLLGVVFVSTRAGLRASIAAAAMSILAFDFFFVPPYLTLAVADLSHVITFGVMFVVAVVIGGLTDRLRQQREAARIREQRTSALYAMSRELGVPRDPAELALVASRHLHEVFGSRTAILLADDDGALRAQTVGPHAFEPNGRDQKAIERVQRDHRAAGRWTDALPDSAGTYVPLSGPHGFLGVLGVLPPEVSHPLDPEQKDLLEAFARLTASALERSVLAERAQRAQVEVEAERLRSNLLSSVSHDLRTPLATIEGAATTILQARHKLNDRALSDLTGSIVDETRRLARLVRNLLDMTRLEAGGLTLKRESEAIEEIIGATLTRLAKQLEGRPVRTRVPDDLPLVPMDPVLIEQVLTNLLENAVRYTPDGTAIDITARVDDRALVVEVADQGPGLPPGMEQRVFDKFTRGQPGSGELSVGLGLTICRSIMTAHGGTITAMNRAGGGAIFRFSLPLPENPARLDEAPNLP